MISSLHPAAVLILGCLFLPFLKGKVRSAVLLLLPVLGFVNVLGLEHGHHWSVTMAGFEMELLRVDKLSLLFAYLFHIAAFLGALYSLHLDDDTQHVSGLMYAGSAVGTVFAGDLLTMFVFWELMAVTSVFQIWATRTPSAIRAGNCYLIL
jgi:formate hydrogenlyase subunit 3/multisubunit Na+/H+ antiporter MnhD subunit